MLNDNMVSLRGYGLHAARGFASGTGLSPALKQVQKLRHAPVEATQLKVAPDMTTEYLS